MSNPPGPPSTPRKDTRFQKGQSGNPRDGRETRVGLIPSQLRKDILRVMELPVTVKTPQGDQTLTVREASIYLVAKQALAGEKVAYVRMWNQMQKEAIDANLAAYPGLSMIEIFDAVMREGKGDIGIEKSLEALIRKSKGLDPLV